MLAQHKRQPKLRHFFQLNKYWWMTLFEVMAMFLVVALAISGLFFTLTQSITFSRDTEARIKAIALAREGVEAMYNIRNTNWLRFSSDRKNCWNTLNYNSTCIGGINTTNTITEWSYVLYRENGLWKLKKPGQNFNTSNFSATENNDYQIWITPDGWYSANAGTPPPYDMSVACKNQADFSNPNKNTVNCRSIFFREITVNSVEWDNGSNNPPLTKMSITANVYWYNKWPKKIQLSADITNWKARYSE